MFRSIVIPAVSPTFPKRKEGNRSGSRRHKNTHRGEFINFLGGIHCSRAIVDEPPPAGFNG